MFALWSLSSKCKWQTRACKEICTCVNPSWEIKAQNRSLRACWKSRSKLSSATWLIHQWKDDSIWRPPLRGRLFKLCGGQIDGSEKNYAKCNPNQALRATKQKYSAGYKSYKEYRSFSRNEMICSVWVWVWYSLPMTRTSKCQSNHRTQGSGTCTWAQCFS
jgi:hypothetical protein